MPLWPGGESPSYPGSKSFGGQVLGASGTDAAPGYAFSAAPSSGFFLQNVATGAVAASAVGVRVFRITNGPAIEMRLNAALSWSSGEVGSATDVILARTAAGSMTIGGVGNGQLVGIKQLVELLTIAAAPTTDTTIQFPAGSLGLGVTVRVTTTIPTAATFDVGIAGATTRYGTGILVAAGTTNVSPGTTNPSIYAAATAVRITPNLTPGAATGVVRVTLHYLDLVAATS